MKLDAQAAVAATQAVVAAGAALPPSFGVSTDTRSLMPGDAFVALRGERFDGHDFAGEAVARGAGVLIVEEASGAPAGIAALVVADTKAAYVALGALARRALRARIIAVTGSTGKTTTRTFLAQILAGIAPGKVAASAANENNEIGVAKSLLAIEPDAAYAVLELGARHYGEIAPLVRAVAPHVALLTNIGDAHLEIMGSQERLAETKWGIFSTGAAAVLNAADATSRAWADKLPAPPTWFSLDDEADGCALSGPLVTLRGRERLVVRGAADAREYACEVTVAGDHNRRNAVAAVATALALGVPASAAAATLGELTLPQGRYERIVLSDCEAIYDAYNASMSGTLATLQSFAAEPATRRIAVLASMAELGADAPAMHARVGAAAAHACLEALLVGGDFATDLARGARGAGYDAARIVPFADNAAAADWLRRNVRPGDLVLFKGSRRYRLEDVVADLRSVHA